MARLGGRERCAEEEEGGADGDADSGVDISLSVPDGDDDETRGEIVGFVMWRRDRKLARERREDDEEWDWLAQLPKGANMSLWKRYTEVMSSDPVSLGDDGIGKHPSLSALALTKIPHLNS